MALSSFYADRQAFDDMEEGRRKNALARNAGSLMAQGDMTGGRNALWRGGALDAGNTVNTQIATSQKAQGEALDRFTKGVNDMIAAGYDPQQAWATGVELAPRLGIDRQALERHKPAFDKDPKGWSTFWNAKAKEYQLFQNDTGIYGVNKSDPKDVITSKQFPYVRGDYMYAPVEGVGAVGPAAPPHAGTPGIAPQRGTATTDTSGNTVPPPPAPPSYRDAIANIESRGSGDYSAQGPRTRTGDRAYGRYQVMGANIPQWTQEVLGRRMTPQEFLANPQAQDAVFDAKFGGYVQQYGSPEEAASVWFTGKPMAQGANRRDVNGMTGARYVQKFAQNAGAQPLQGGPQGDDLGQAPQIPGMRVVGRVKGGEAGVKWTRSQDGKYLINENGDVKEDPRGKPAGGGISVPASAGLTDLGGGFYQDKVGRIYQPNSVGVLTQTAGITDGAVAKAVENVTGLNSALSSLDRFDAAIRQLSPRDFGPLGNYTGDQAKFATAKAAATELMMTMKSPAMFNLGVITGPDMEILTGVIEDPAKWGSLIRKNQIVPKLTQLASGIGAKHRAELASFKALGGKPEGLPTLFKSPRSGQKAAAPSGQKRLSPAEAAKLKPGTKFIGQDGVERIRQ